MKNKINTVLFDLDGTLLPFNQDEFVHNYFSRLAKKLIPMGFEKDSLIQGILAGMDAMFNNDGTKTNEDAFWEVFEELLKVKREDLLDVFEEFYTNEFDEVKEIIPEGSSCRELIDKLKDKGYTLVLATNPLFPKEAVATRLSWIDLSPEDFTLVTTFDNSVYCKPNIEYYENILKEINKKPEECVMIGNNTVEDMVCEKIGITVGLVVTNIENKGNHDINKFVNGTLSEVVDALL